MTDRIEKTMTFVRRKLAENPWFQARPEAGAYRLEHTLRVAGIGREIARREGFPVEDMVLACLLHDVGYCRTFANGEEQMAHGRASARIARPFLRELGLGERETEAICFAVAVHADGQADFPGERTAFAMTVADADNIDRFGAYRLYETLENAGFSALPPEGRLAHTEGILGKLEEYLTIDFATPSATAMWRDRIRFYREFYLRLREQLLAGGVRSGGASGTAEDAARRWMGLAGRP